MKQDITRREYEDRLLDAFEAFENVWRELNPEGQHISAFIVEGNMHIVDYDSPENPMATRYADGVRSYSTGEITEETGKEATTDVGSE